MTGHTEPTDAEPARPALRIVRGDPTPEEVAALVAVLATSATEGEAPPARHRSRWSDPAVRLGTTRRWTSRPS